MRHKSKVEIEALRKRLLELHAKDPEMNQVQLASRLGIRNQLVSKWLQASSEVPDVG